MLSRTDNKELRKPGQSEKPYGVIEDVKVSEGLNGGGHHGSTLLLRHWPRCQRCGGQVLRDWEGWFCLQCGAEYDQPRGTQ